MRRVGRRDWFLEVLCVLGWSEDARQAYVKALRSYNRAGRPPVPLGVFDYRKKYKHIRRS